MEGQTIQGCPWDLVPPEVYEMVASGLDYEAGHTPVTLGHAQWVPAVYIEAVRLVRAARNEARKR